MTPQWLSLILSILTLLFTIGMFVGYYRQKISTISTTLSDHIKVTHGNKTDLETEFKNRDTSEAEFRLAINAQVKEISKLVNDINLKCAARESCYELVPQLADRMRALEIKTEVIPSKLSKELSDAFSEEYQKFISAILHKAE